MKNITNSNGRDEVITRIEKVCIDDAALWGKMNVHQMICHCADQLRLATGEKKARFVGNKLLTVVVKHLVLLGMPAPKGKVETMPEIKQGVGGTQPKDFEQDKLDLIELINSFENKFGSQSIKRHPAFGDMNLKQWGRLAYIHLNHHLKQFGK